jgi:membrane fusion protein, heavy metal efflux system
MFHSIIEFKIISLAGKLIFRQQSISPIIYLSISLKSFVMKNYIKSVFGILLMGFIVSSCGSTTIEQHDDHGDQEEHEEHAEEGTVSLSEQQMDAIGLKLLQIEKRNMNIAVQVTGSLELAPQDRADVSPVLGGIVKQINVFEGDKVKKGDVLVVLEHPDYIQLQQDYISNLRMHDYLEKEYERQQRLYDEKVGSGKDFQKISAEYNNSEATTMALEAKLNMLGLDAEEVAKGKIFPTLNIVSPMDGSINLVETNMGAYAEPLSKLFEVVNNDKLHADLMVYERDISKVRLGQKIYFSTSSLPELELEAKIYAISPAFENDPKVIHVHANITRKNKALIPGMYIHGRIVADNIMTVALPEHAIVVEGGKSYIFVKTDGEDHDHGHDKESVASEEHDHDAHGDEAEEEHEHDAGEEAEEHGHDGHEEGNWTFEMVEVITGIASGGYVEIKLLDSLPEGAQIAGNASYYLLAEMGKGETEHSH